MVHHPAFRVNKRPFAIVGMDQSTSGASLSINLGRDAQCTLLDDARFSRTPYIGQHGWVTINSARLRKGELDMLVTEGYRRVANKKQLAMLDRSPEPGTPPLPKQTTSAKSRNKTTTRSPSTKAAPARTNEMRTRAAQPKLKSR